MSRLRPKMNAAKHQHRRNGDGCWISCSMRWRGSPPRRSAGPSMRRRRRPRGSSHMPQAMRPPRPVPGAGLPPSGRATTATGPRGGPAGGAGAPSRPRAGACHVCLRASRLCRMRPCEAMERSLLPFRAGPSASWQVGGTCLGESLAGSGARSTAGMPGAPRRHGGAVHARGISGLKACIACGADGAGDGLCRLADRGRPGDGALEEAARGIGPGTWAAAGARQGCRRALPAPGIAEHAAARTDLQEDGKKTEASSFRKTPPGQCSCLVSFIRSRSLRRSSS